MYFQFKLFLFLIIINYNSGSINNQEELKKGLVIVLDISSSMYDEIEILRINLKSLLDNVFSRRHTSIEHYILVQFDDEEINTEFIKPQVYTNYRDLKNSLDNVIINQRNIDESCAASCYRGLKRGLDLVSDESDFLVFTDAGTKHNELLPEIKNITQQKRTSFYFTLTKGCDRTTPDDDYRNLISLYNGDIYNVDTSNRDKIKMHFDLLAQILTGPPLAPTVDVIVDSIMSDFILTVTGKNAIITIFNPKGKYMPSTRYKMLTDIETIKMIKVSDLMPGRYTIQIVTESVYTGQVQITSDLQFKFGFSVYEPSSMNHLHYAPLRGRETYLAISPSNISLISNLDYVVLTTSNDKQQYKLHKKFSQDEYLFVTDSFTIPNESFQIYIHGLDRLQFEISRLISPFMNAISDERPLVDTDKKVDVQEGDAIHLICRVKSMLNVTVQWFKIGLNASVKIAKFQQSDTLNYTIDDSRISDSGEYFCMAENDIGITKSKSIVTVKQTRLTVQTSLKSVETEIGTKKVVLKCNVSPHSKYVKVSWLFNGKPNIPHKLQNIQLDSDLVLFNITRNFSGKYTCVGQKGAEQKQASTQLNVMYPPNILNLTNFNTNKLIDATEPLKIINNEKQTISCNYESYPEPTVQWISPNNDVISNNFVLNFDNITESGEYSCQVENQMGQTERKIEIIVSSQTNVFEQDTTEGTSPVLLGPSILEFQVIDDFGDRTFEAKDQDIDILNQSYISIICKTTGIPIPSTQWRKDNIVVSTTNNLTISDSPLKLNFTGVYECVTENVNNISKLAITLKQIMKPIVKQNYNKTVELIEGTSFTLRCPIEIGDYNVTWFLNEKSIDNFKLPDNSIYIEVVDLSMNGDVICIASNKASSAKATFSFDILRPPYDLVGITTIDKYPIVNETYEIKCSAKGKPKPKMIWIKNDIYFSSGNSLHFDKFQTDNIGKYICIAENYLGIANKTFILRESVGKSNVTHIVKVPNNAGKIGASTLVFVFDFNEYFVANFEL